MELQKAANQGRRCTWEKLSAIKANCGIELALDECVAILNHMRRLKRSADRAAAAASSHGLSSTVKFSASRRIPSWNCIARENSTGSLDDDILADAASSFHQVASGHITGGPSGKNLRTHRTHDGSDSEPESVDQPSWTRTGGPLMRTTSANKFIDFVQNLDIDTELNRGLLVSPNSTALQMASNSDYFQSPRGTTSDRSSESADFDQRDFRSRVTINGSSIMVSEGDLLQPERTENGIVFNIVKKDELALANRSQDFENYNSDVAECVQMDCPEKESSASECGDAENAPETCENESEHDIDSLDHSGADDLKDQEPCA